MAEAMPPVECRALIGMSPGTLNEERRTIAFVASTDIEDAHGEIVEQSWRLERIRKNPVFLWDHNGWRNSSEQRLPIGRMLTIDASGNRLDILVEFAPKELNPWADTIFRNYVSGFLRAVSVGFWPNEVWLEKREGREIFVLSDNELFEVSAVPIGSNPDAVALGIDPKNASDSDVREALARSREGHLSALRAIANRRKNMAITAEKSTEELEAARAKAEKEAAEAREAKALAEKAALEARAEAERATAEAERATAEAKERAEKAERQIRDMEVRALVGKKLLPAEIDVMLEVRSALPDALWARMIDARSELGVLTPGVGAKGAPLEQSSVSAPAYRGAAMAEIDAAAAARK